MSHKKQPVVLVVEDNPTGIASLVGILGAACELVVAKSLAEAKRCLSPDMDAVLLDLYLPDGKGIEFLKRLKSAPAYRELPVICISASDQSSDIEEAFREGAIDYVLKPFNKIILSAKVSTFVDFKRKTDLLAAQALRDTLTGIGNRRMFEQQLDLEWRRALRNELSLGLALVDMDHFKNINDQYGHAQGDSCLQLLATSMEKVFGRAGDLVARLGGDEFVAMLPSTTLNGTVRAAKRLEQVLEAELETCRHTGQACPNFSVSVGCYAVVPHKETNSSELKEAADQYLYEAKREGGRNCVRPAI